jgi:hypothetical protein
MTGEEQATIALIEASTQVKGSFSDFKKSLTVLIIQVITLYISYLAFRDPQLLWSFGLTQNSHFMLIFLTLLFMLPVLMVFRYIKNMFLN